MLSVDTCGSDAECVKDSSVKYLWDWTNSVPFPPPDDEDDTSISSTCTGNLTEPEPNSNSTTYCSVDILPKTIANADFTPTSEDNDGDDINQTFAISISISLAVIFLVVISLCIYSRQKCAKSNGGDENDNIALRESTIGSSDKYNV